MQIFLIIGDRYINIPHEEPRLGVMWGETPNLFRDFWDQTSDIRQRTMVVGLLNSSIKTDMQSSHGVIYGLIQTLSTSNLRRIKPSVSFEFHAHHTITPNDIVGRISNHLRTSNARHVSIQSDTHSNITIDNRTCPSHSWEWTCTFRMESSMRSYNPFILPIFRSEKDRAS